MTIELLTTEATNEEIIAKINEVIEAINAHKPRNYGPKSTRKMERLDAWRIMFGDLIDVSVKDVANDLGLSKGQVYSVKGNYTFRDVKEDEFTIDDVLKLELQ